MAAANSSTSTSNTQPPSGSHTGTSSLASKSLRSLISKLVQLCDSQSSKDASNRELEWILHHLKSSRVRSQESARVFRENGGIEALLNISSKLQPIPDNHCKTLALIWGTLANVCALEDASRDKVQQQQQQPNLHLFTSFSCIVCRICSE